MTNEQRDTGDETLYYPSEPIVKGFKAGPPEQVKPAGAGTRVTVPANMSPRASELMSKLAINPVKAAELAEIVGSNDFSIGSYLMDGSVFVYVDSHKIDKLNTLEIKRKAFAYRYQINMPNAGIQSHGSAHVLQPSEKPESTLKGAHVYRIIFKLTEGI